MAPEILNDEKYDHKVDIWSCGIMLQMMLTGQLPFPVDEKHSLYKNVASYAPTSKHFEKFSYLTKDSIDFLMCCLQRDPTLRYDATALLEHKWIQSQAPDVELPTNISKEIALNLKQFNARFKLEQAVYTYLATNASTLEDEKHLRQMFLNMDTSKDGLISKEEFIAGMRKAKTKVNFTEEELYEMFEEMDADLSGNIDYTEFIRAAMNKSKMLTEKNLKAAFNFFDQDHNGYITKDEIKSVFAKGNVILEEDLIDIMLAEVDSNHDNNVRM
jgi:calcium-dependent protein kinase